MSRLWSEDEDRVIRWARRRGIARMVIGRHIDRTAEAIRERERRLGLLPLRIPGEATEYRARFIWNGGFEVGYPQDSKSRVNVGGYPITPLNTRGKLEA